jgi:hypothetical protein
VTRYNQPVLGDNYKYQEGVDRILEYIESIHRYDKLVAELKWAIKEGII